MKISLVSTVLNDRLGLEEFFEAMAGQSRQPDEIVLVDGGSTDGTWEAMQAEARKPRGSVPVIVKRETGCNVARGRDLAIAMSSGRIITSTDIGCKWDPMWLEELVAPFHRVGDDNVDVVIGSWAVRADDCRSSWAKVELARRFPFRLEATPESLGINRSIAYRREVWEKVGGYPQDLTLAADDVVFDMIIRQPKWKFVFAAAPKVRCYWERHETLTQFGKEERRNFFGAAEAGIWLKYFVLVAGRLAAESSCLLGSLALFLPMPWRLIGVGMLVGILASVLLRIFSFWPARRRLRGMGVSFPLLRLLLFEYFTKVCGIAGYVRGILRGAQRCQQTRERLGR